MAPSHSLFVTTEASSLHEISVKSPAFVHMGSIPQKYTADGANVNPPLVLSKIPLRTKSMVLMVEDPNAPVDTWVHWLVWNIMPTTFINEASVPGVQGLNAFLHHHYYGPCPPANMRQYYYKVYALDTILTLHQSSTKYEVMKAMKDHVIGYGELIGTYERNHNNDKNYGATAAPSDIFY